MWGGRHEAPNFGILGSIVSTRQAALEISLGGRGGMGSDGLSGLR